MRLLIFQMLMMLPFLSLSQSDHSSSLYFLNLILDARSSGMGDAGIATSPDAYSQNVNPSKFLFISKSYGISATYTPWMQKLVSDMNLIEISGYACTELQSFSGSVRYFSFGETNLIDENKENTGRSSPYQMSLNASYARRLSQCFAMGITLKYIRSDIFPKDYGYNVANAIAADISTSFNKPVELMSNQYNLSIGGLVTNLGTKIKYKNNTYEELLPMSFKLGVGVASQINSNNQFQVTTELHNYLFPATNSEQTAISAFINSVGRKNYGSLAWNIGGEYSIKETFFVRLGFYKENNRFVKKEYFTLGVGVKYGKLQLDFSQLLSTSSYSQFLNNTYKISMAYILVK